VDLLIAHFVGALNARFGVRRHVGPAALEVLRQYDWPGNVRELHHVVEAAVVVCDGPEILPEHLLVSSRALHPARSRIASAASLETLPTLEQVERAHIELALDLAGGHRGNAARSLGISERNLYRKLTEYRLLP
jgi:two-component system NtrC family response regulator/two-component system response regulator AtoC